MFTGIDLEFDISGRFEIVIAAYNGQSGTQCVRYIYEVCACVFIFIYIMVMDRYICLFYNYQDNIICLYCKVNLKCVPRYVESPPGCSS